MTYKETTDWLFAQLPNYQLQGSRALFKNLNNISQFCYHLKQPQNNFPSIHVAGTNGKGSTSHMLSSVLQAAGFKVGLYTSPHLKDFRERIKISGSPISEDEVVEFVQTNLKYIREQQLSFFELTVAMAFDTFAKHQVDVAVIEVGLGGRLDATNVILPILSVITNIGLDHTKFLGHTLPEIAFEKAGIIKPNVPVVIGEYTIETKEVFENQASKMNAAILFASEFDLPVYDCDLKGSYQRFNVRTAAAAIYKLKRLHWKIPEQAMVEGFKSVVSSTQFLGRWQQLSQQPAVYCDVAHNADGIRVLFDQVKNMAFGRLLVVFGVMKDKDLDSIVHLLPTDGSYFCCRADNARALSSDSLSTYLQEQGLEAQSCGSVGAALESAQTVANTDDLILICGSNFVVAEII